MDGKPPIENAVDSAAKTHAKQFLIPTLGNIINRHKETHKSDGDVDDVECLGAQTSSKSQSSAEKEGEDRQCGVILENDKPIPVSRPPLPRKPTHNLKPEIIDSKPGRVNGGKDEFHAVSEQISDKRPSSDNESAKQEQRREISADMFLQSNEITQNSDDLVAIANREVEECACECDNIGAGNGLETDFTKQNLIDCMGGHIKNTDTWEGGKKIPSDSVKGTIVQQSCHDSKIDDLSIVHCNEQDTNNDIVIRDSRIDKDSTDILKAPAKSQILEESEINLKKQEIARKDYVDSHEEPCDIKPNSTLQNARAPEIAPPVVQPNETFKPKPRRPPPLPPSILQQKTSQPLVAPNPPARDTSSIKNEYDVPKLEAASFENGSHHGFGKSRVAVKRKPIESSDYVKNITKTIEGNKHVSGSPDISVTGPGNHKKDLVASTKDDFSHIKAMYDTPRAIVQGKLADKESVPEISGALVKNKTRFTGSIFKKHGSQKEGIVAKKKAEYDENLKKDVNDIKEEHSRKQIKDIYKMPFVKKRNKGRLREVKEERKSCPPSVLNYQKELDGQQPPENKVQSKALANTPLPMKAEPKEPEVCTFWMSQDDAPSQPRRTSSV